MAQTSDILVVDDEPKNLTAIEVVLNTLDVRLTTARSGEEALRHLLHQDYAAILLDVQMPDMDGFETARLIRTRDRMRHVPILFVTAYNQHDADIRRGYELGAVDYLFKPIVPEVLRAKVQVFVDLRDRTLEVGRQAEKLREIERMDALRRLEEERRKWEAESLRGAMREQRRINQQLEEADRRKDDFIALLAHELRNPLAPLVTGLELIRLQGIDNPIVVRAREAMERQVHHLTRLVDDLLDVSRISKGKLELHRERVDLRAIVEDAADACRALVEQRNQRLVVEGPDAPIPLEADPVRLAQVVSNLLSNAARYSEPEQPILVGWGLEDDCGWVRVVDRGRGIAPEFIERVFEMFAQERDGGKGLGLGLTLVKQLVEMHGGSVEARSDGRGKGSEFVVRLPLAVGDSPALAPRTPPPRAGRSLSVVVVEDDLDIRDALESLLAIWGHEVSIARDGHEGVEMISRLRPDVALVDIGLPGIDGYEVARAVRAAFGDGPPRLIAMTGFGQESDQRRAYEAGFDRHLVKPSSPEELRAALEESNDSSGPATAQPVLADE